MDKQNFLDILERKLSAYPISDEDVKKQLSDMERFLATVSDEEFTNESPTEDDIADIALSIIQRFYSRNKRETAVSENVTQAPVEEAARVQEESVNEEAEELKNENEPAQEAPEAPLAEEEDVDVLDILAKEAQEERKDKETYEELKRLAIERAIAEQDEIITNNIENDPIEDIVDPAERPDIAFDETEAISNPEEESQTPYTISDADDFYVDEDDIVSVEEYSEDFEIKKVKRKKKREKIKGTPLFWALTVLTLPISVPILALIAALFAAGYLAVTLLIVGFSAAMIACVAIGTALSLVGVIYGIIEAVKIPVLGIFEVGIGISIGGVTILVALLLYNIAMRYLPILYKLITRFARYVIEKIADLFYNIKKECGR